VVDALSARVEIKKEKDYQILLDNQCQIHIFANDHLLSNIHQTDHLMCVCGEVEGNFKTDMVGNFLDFEDDVYISPSAKTNLLSFSLVSKLFQITWDQDTDVHRYYSSRKLLFRNVDDLFVCDVRRDIIKLNQYQSVPEVENKIRTLKNRIRSKLASLNFILLDQLISYLVYDSTTNNNMMTTKNCVDNTWKFNHPSFCQSAAKELFQVEGM
jgi:hypothetical protein